MSDSDLPFRLKQALSLFITPKYVVTDDTYLKKLSKHISEGSKSSGDMQVIKICMDWLSYILKSWQITALHPPLKAFVLEVVGHVISDEDRFKIFQETGGIDRLIVVLNINDSSDSSTKTAFVAVLTSLLNHDFGRNFLMESGLWKNVINYCYEAKSIYVTRASQNFISTLLNYMVKEPSICMEIVSYVLSPLINKETHPNTNVLTKNSMDVEGECENELLPVLELISHVFETSMTMKPSVSYFILQQVKLENLAWNLLKDTKRNLLIEVLSKLLNLIYFTLLCNQAKEHKVTLTDFKEFEKKLYSLLSLLLQKAFEYCMKVLVQAQIYWKKISISITYDAEKDAKKYVFENQLITLQLVPVICSIRTTKVSENECLDTYRNKLFDLTYESTQRLCYAYRDVVSNQTNHREMLYNGILGLLQIKNILHRDQATIAFQALMYMLKDFVPDSEGHSSSPNRRPLSDEILMVICPDVLSLILETIAILICSFQITWRESLETVCLFTFMHQLLKSTNLSSQLAVKTFQLMQIVIQNFVPPNLALLVNTLDGSSISQLGPLLFKRMHDEYWEVRDSALEVLRVVATISELKFTAFQDHILENELGALCTSMALHDAESYVRASAISCLCVMVRIEKMWIQCLSIQNLAGKMIHILKHESEGIVRREAAALIKELFEHQKISKSLMDNVYSTMAITAIKDLHWEVQINALNFWQKVIEHHMSNQGMIDGEFPSVTFSREHRKIVTLNEKEIQLRLKKVLQELSDLGCLSVLMTSLHDCTLQVAIKSTEILSYVSKLLIQHGILTMKNNTAENEAVTPVPTVLNSAESILFSNSTISGSNLSRPCKAAKFETPKNRGISPSNMIPGRFGESEKVIDAIVKETDINLLQQVYQNQLNIVAEEERTFESKNVSPEFFLSQLSEMDLKKHVSDRTKWLNYCHDDLNSLLDDILASSGVGQEFNMIDCY